ncbi:hypothetical protein G3A56_01500 [Rhizobium oryzihabitans]|uniref:Ead/Ea22-like family protein n=1 Tax=Rhizobium oryzihabitans TaxID=2267833 RepID=A0A7L5BD97_9HYPH|nr:hypothetical protein [Rhizobium oryzihabitans]QIB36835.1 hypothetical protein G3A56_01500 [Rhizobium oryzihabitans]
MTALEEIKKALEGVGPLKVEFTPDCDEFNAIIAPINEDYDGTFFTVIGCGDKQDKLGGFMAIAVNAMPELLSTLESLQRENDILRASRDGYAKQRDEILRLYDEERISCIREAKLATDMATDCNDAQARAEAAEAEVKRLEDVIEPFRAVSKDWVDENGWTDVACQNDRIVEWFGPSDFRALASTGGEHHAE